MAKNIFHNEKNTVSDVEKETGDSVACRLLSMHRVCIRMRVQNAAGFGRALKRLFVTIRAVRQSPSHPPHRPSSQAYLVSVTVPEPPMMAGPTSRIGDRFRAFARPRFPTTRSAPEV